MPAEPGRAGARGCPQGPGSRSHPTSRARTQPGLAALTCRRPRAPLGSSTCVPAPGAAAADPGSCPAASSPLLPDSEAAAPSGKLPASSRRWSSLPACAPLLRGRRLPSARQGAPEGRGVCATCAKRGAGGVREPGVAPGVGGWGVCVQMRRRDKETRRPRCSAGAGIAGSQPSRRDVHSGPTDSPGSAAGSALPCRLLLGWEGPAGRSEAAAVRILPQASPTRRRRSRLAPRRGRGGWVAQGLISVLPGVRSLPKAGAGLGSPFALRRLCPAFPPPGLLSAGFGRKEI